VTGPGPAPAYRLDNPVRDYDWGSTTAIPRLLGVPPTGLPQAELWMGAHPSAPSRLAGDGTLAERIAADPGGELGDAVLAEFGARLPFLVKVLAAERPLSLQAHPTREQARAGYAAENARGVPLDAPTRNYRDQSHKPELLCALTPFRALGGFRALPDTVRLLDRLGVPELAPYRELLAAPDGLRQVVTAVLTLPAGRRAELVDAVAAACQAGPDGGFAAERRAAAELAAAYPGDPGVVIALLLNHVELAPGQALFMPAGNLHTYLSGTGVEIMANSDNVLRGGLTGKHIDVPELLRVLDFTAGPPPLVPPRPGPGGEVGYPVPVREFRLARHEVAGRPATVDGGVPQILLCVEGSLELSGVDGGSVPLPRGASAFVPADRKAVTLSGRGTAFRARTNLG
jgi:mannose-6-phosphate isomerase